MTPWIPKPHPALWTVNEWGPGVSQPVSTAGGFSIRGLWTRGHLLSILKNCLLRCGWYLFFLFYFILDYCWCTGKSPISHVKLVPSHTVVLNPMEPQTIDPSGYETATACRSAQCNGPYRPVSKGPQGRAKCKRNTCKQVRRHSFLFLLLKGR